MDSKQAVLAIDQGTTSSRSIMFDKDGESLASAQLEFEQIFPHSGWVEHNPEDIWKTTVSVTKSVLDQCREKGVTASTIGITNQRETTVIWERATGKPIYNAIVWQDRRTADLCLALKKDGHDDPVQQRTGLLIDPYFSATKISWVLDNVAGAREAAERGDLAFGTIDTFLLWRLTGGKVHATDVTNASRTMLYNIRKNEWDSDLLELFNVPSKLLPKVLDNAAEFGTTDPGLFGGPIPVTGMAGDQQAAAVGQSCFERGMMKSTYGTGCFVVLNTGARPITSHNKMLTTICYRLDGKTTYALEGSIFIAGAAVQWLRDALQLIGHAAETEELAASLEDNQGVYLVPAFTGLGAPYWDPRARGALLGLTRDTGIKQVVRSALESVCYQTKDLMNAMLDDGATNPKALRVDGGMASNNWVMQFLADILQVPVERPVVTETTALGAAQLAALGAGLHKNLGDISRHWKRDRLFEPRMDETASNELYEGWQDAVERVRSRSMSTVIGSCK
jgi:glycerol kinase